MLLFELICEVTLELVCDMFDWALEARRVLLFGSFNAESDLDFFNFVEFIFCAMIGLADLDFGFAFCLKEFGFTFVLGSTLCVELLDFVTVTLVTALDTLCGFDLELLV